MKYIRKLFRKSVEGEMKGEDKPLSMGDSSNLSQATNNLSEQFINARDIKDSIVVQVVEQNNSNSMSQTVLENKLREASNFYKNNFIFESIQLYEGILNNISINEFRSQQGFVYGQLGQLYTLYSRIKDREKNLVCSINAYQTAIKIFGEIDDKKQLSDNYSNLGIAYCRMAEIRNSEENYLQALAVYEKSNLISGKEDDIQGYLETLSSMGNTYCSLSQFSNKIENLDNSLKLFNEISENINESNPLYGNMLVNTAKVLKKKYELTLGINYLKESISLLNKALDLYGIENDSDKYSLINNNLSTAHRELSHQENAEENVKLAIKFSSKALQIRTKDRWPVDYAHTSMISGHNYIRQAELSNNESDLEFAIVAFNEALSIFTLIDNPIENAHVNFLLGNAYHLLANIKDKQSNLNNAIAYIEHAEEVYKKKHKTIDLAKINLKLGQLHRELFLLGRENSMKIKALDYLRRALPIFVKEEINDLTVITNREIFTLSNN